MAAKLGNNLIPSKQNTITRLVKMQNSSIGLYVIPKIVVSLQCPKRYEYAY